MGFIDKVKGLIKRKAHVSTPWEPKRDGRPRGHAPAGLEPRNRAERRFQAHHLPKMIGRIAMRDKGKREHARAVQQARPGRPYITPSGADRKAQARVRALDAASS